MRRIGLVASAVVVAGLLWPRPAQAWWGWWDELSGAGPFKGFEFEARLACFGEVTTHPANDGSLTLVQRQLDYEIVRYRATDAPVAELVRRLDAFNVLVAAAAASKTVTAQTLTAIAADARGIYDGLFPQRVADAKAPLAPPLQRVANSLLEVSQAATDAARRVNALNKRTGSAGVVFSACPVRRDINRRVSINATFRLMRTYGERKAEYAGGNEISLAMFVPTIAWRPLADLPKIDIIDLSAGGGVYWFSSEGSRSGALTPFSGVILEPIRVDFHFPTIVAQEGWAGAILAGLSYRRGRALFPAGFEANAFGATRTPEQSQQLPAEWVKNKAIFWDFAPLIHYWMTRPRGD